MSCIFNEQKICKGIKYTKPYLQRNIKLDGLRFLLDLYLNLYRVLFQLVLDVNECNTSRPCDVNAQCINTPTSFQCVCNTGYQGNGLACAAVVKPQEENNGWSNDDIVIVSVVFALAFVIIVFLAVAAFIFYKKSDNTTYSTSKNFRESGYDNYLKTDENVDHLKMNMYVAVDPVASSHQSFKTQNETKLNNGRSNGQRKI